MIKIIVGQCSSGTADTCATTVICIIDTCDAGRGRERGHKGVEFCCLLQYLQEQCFPAAQLPPPPRGKTAAVLPPPPMSATSGPVEAALVVHYTCIAHTIIMEYFTSITITFGMGFEVFCITDGFRWYLRLRKCWVGVLKTGKITHFWNFHFVTCLLVQL